MLYAFRCTSSSKLKYQIFPTRQLQNFIAQLFSTEIQSNLLKILGDNSENEAGEQTLAALTTFVEDAICLDASLRLFRRSDRSPSSLTRFSARTGARVMKR